MSKNYWAKRQERIQTAIADKTIEETEKQLKKYYAQAMKSIISDFERVYDKIQLAVEDGREPTPADLYKLDQYWQMQGQLRKELQKLGDKENALLSKKFEAEWNDIYKATALPSDKAFSTISKQGAKQMINSVWLADGKTFSQRVWGNIDNLTETLNEKLIECIVSGKKPTELKQMLMERFNVSYSQANTLVRTETANIQTEAAAQRYKDYGIEKYEFLGREEHDIGCKCKELNGKVFLLSEKKAGVNAPPLHPNCRCCIIPVIEDNELEENKMEEKNKNWYDLDEEQNKQLERVYKEYPEVKAKRQEIDIFNQQRKQRYEDRIKEIDDILSGNKSIEEFSLRQNLLVVNGRGGKVISPNWQSRIKKIQEYDIRELEYMKAEDKFVLDSFIFCIDCGKPIPVNGRKTNAVKRCAECQEKYRKKYKAQKEAERRAKRKTK